LQGLPPCTEFSFCVALHEALTGRHPFGADEPGATREQALARALRGDVSAGPRSTPAWLRDVVRRGLAPAPAARHPSMHALVGELAATPGRRLRRRLVLAGVAATLVASAGAAAGARGWVSAPCRDLAGELDGVWDDEVRAAGRAAFTASGLAHAGDVWTRLDPRVAEYVGAWRVAREQTCHARHAGGSLVDGHLRLREACLLRRRAELAGLTGLLVAADADTVASAVAAVDHLTPIAVCDEAEVLRREAAAIDPAADLAAVEAIRQDILGLRAQVLAGHAQAVAPRAEARAAEARAHGPVVLAEALQLRGDVEEALGDHDAAAASLTAAVHEAIAGRHDRLHAELAVRRVWLDGVQRRRFAESPARVAHAEAAIRALGGDPRLTARLLDHRGAIASREHDHATAERLHREALALRAAGSPRSTLDQAMSRSNLGLALLSQGKVDAAEPHIRAALDDYGAALGPHHPTVAAVLSNLGQAQIQAGRHERGLALLHEALARKQHALGRGHVALITTLNNLGSAYSAAGEPARAREHYLRALAIGERELGPDSAELESIVHNLAFEAWQAGDHAAVIREASRALELQQRHYGGDNPILAPTLELLARGQLGSGSPQAAAATIDRALALAPAGSLEPTARGSVLLSAAWIKRACGAAPALVRALADEAGQLLGPAPAPDQAQELAALRSP